MNSLNNVGTRYTMTYAKALKGNPGQALRRGVFHVATRHGVGRSSAANAEDEPML